MPSPLNTSPALKRSFLTSSTNERSAIITLLQNVAITHDAHFVAPEASIFPFSLFS